MSRHTDSRTWPHEAAFSHTPSLLAKHMALQRNVQTMTSLHHHVAPSPISEPRFSSDDDEESQSPINLRINTSLKVTSSNNVVCFTESPADHANAIARAVIRAMEEHSAGRCGIPMIDEDGAPRPINIEVDAGITIEGEGNLVTGREMDVLRHLQEQSSRRSSVAVKREKSESRESSPCKKKGRPS